MPTFNGIDWVCSADKDGLKTMRWKAIFDISVTVTTDPAQLATVFLNPALTALPNYGAKITVLGQSFTLTQKNCRSIANSPEMAEIELVWERDEFEAFGGPGQELIYRGGASLQTIETEKDRAGNQVFVEHKDVKQGVLLSVQVPVVTISVDVIEETNTPEQLQLQWVGKVNGDFWKSGDPGTWMVVSAPYEPENLFTSPRQWRFTYTFQYNPRGWQPEAIYIDPETQLPPEGLVADEGIKEFEFYEEAAFAAKFT